MNIIDTTYRGIYSVSLNLNELSDRGINSDKICITDGNDVILHASRGILVTMRDRLNELFPRNRTNPNLACRKSRKKTATISHNRTYCYTKI